MSAKAVYETDGKSLLAKWLQNSNYVKNKFAVGEQDTNWDEMVKENPWIATEVCLFRDKAQLKLNDSFKAYRK